MFSDSYSSLSSSNPSPSSRSSLYLVSNLSDIYFTNISPSTTCLYSPESMLPLNLSAAFHSVSSKPMFAVAISIPPKNYYHQKLQKFHFQIHLVLDLCTPNQAIYLNNGQVPL